MLLLFFAERGAQEAANKMKKEQKQNTSYNNSGSIGKGFIHLEKSICIFILKSWLQ